LGLKHVQLEVSGKLPQASYPCGNYGAGADKPRSGQKFGKKGPGQGAHRSGQGQNRGPGGKPGAKFGKKFTKS
ncbi:MAG: hypothetical protein ACKN8Y_06495, partial [Polynucleobacter victoriensis]